MPSEFSHKTRVLNLSKLSQEIFDLLIIGGGITGASTARDAAMRGLKVALVEKHDFAFGTSSRSSKLIHGGLRYLENMEFKLVFEALAERFLLLKTVPHMVRPLSFFMPIYKTGKSKWLITLGMWLYDILALFRATGFHKWLNKKKTSQKYPFLNPEGLLGGFQYYDASMNDDLLVLEILRSAHTLGVTSVNYVEAIKPLKTGERITGFIVRDRENSENEISVRAHQVVVCAGPWTDMVGKLTGKSWKNWLKPSKGVHFLFDLKKISVNEAVVMNDPTNGRISFVIPRPDFGTGMALVGTTDGPTPANPEKAVVEKSDVDYLMGLLHRYFPHLQLKTSDIISAYVGVRPLFGHLDEFDKNDAKSLQKVSREHHIGKGLGGTVVVVGGKYTTHRTMAAEIVDESIAAWQEAHHHGEAPVLPNVTEAHTKDPINPEATFEATRQARQKAKAEKADIPEKLWSHHGAEAYALYQIFKEKGEPLPDVPGFPWLATQLRFAIRHEMTIHLADFYFRRSSLYATRVDQGLPFAETLAQVWAEELGYAPDKIPAELARLHQAIDAASEWKKIFE